jgi:hypothetical protein
MVATSTDVQQLESNGPDVNMWRSSWTAKLWKAVTEHHTITSTRKQDSILFNTFNITMIISIH